MLYYNDRGTIEDSNFRCHSEIFTAIEIFNAYATDRRDEMEEEIAELRQKIAQTYDQMTALTVIEMDLQKALFDRDAKRFEEIYHAMMRDRG